MGVISELELVLLLLLLSLLLFPLLLLPLLLLPLLRSFPSLGSCGRLAPVLFTPFPSSLMLQLGR